ncbi:DUF1127 domain-containing protein [Aliamphritea spongicola]|uniref:DUF1127 domain-containing protein n=1 Tax=Aliamphritea spongicola TaxID=707589 RepID=UPI00196BAC22|nr:DUF1127 domain-containing protein [Aliamphritea spongicola]MBN3561726.1 DUF1127 domain-containing protein [Aliamphritea spongicola]
MSVYNPCYKTEKLNLNADCLKQVVVNRKAQHDGVQSFKERVHCLLKQWLHNWRSRRQLAQLDTAMLKDVGLSRADALAEADKPFWR